jgi:hypothetical protein
MHAMCRGIVGVCMVISESILFKLRHIENELRSHGKDQPFGNCKTIRPSESSVEGIRETKQDIWIVSQSILVEGNISQKCIDGSTALLPLQPTWSSQSDAPPCGDICAIVQCISIE